MSDRRSRGWRGLAGAVLVGLAASGSAAAADVLSVKRMGMALALDIAREAVLACREQGYQVAAVVVDRYGDTQVVLRDDLALRFHVQIARDKANAVVLSGVDSGAFRENRDDIRTEMNHVDDILVLDGGVAVRAGGALLGAVGVSGAPGGERDAACARAALEAVEDRLAFIN